jgi:hypothetical protein
MATTTNFKINEDAVCVLVENKATNSVQLDCVPIKNLLEPQLNELQRICSNGKPYLSDVLSFLKRTDAFSSLSTYFSYCQKLNNAYEGVRAEHNVVENHIKQQLDLIAYQAKHGPADYDAAQQRQHLKLSIYTRYALWAKALSIEAAYQECEKKVNVLAYSHRRCGWSNPVKRLTPNFTVEVKTNFGYGSVSYFYIKLTYKNIEILPFSRWVNYEHGEFSEIIRYTQKFGLDNTEWLPVMVYCKDACNLSLTDEKTFISKYVIAECEEMVAGLEKILTQDSFKFSNGREHYPKSIKGRPLIGFRGEKISGALDFISKILQFKGFTSVSEFVRRIEECNRKLQPVLAAELVKLNQELVDLDAQLTIVKPKFTASVAENAKYETKRNNLKKSMAASAKTPEEKLDVVEFERKFNAQNPEYAEFIQSHRALVTSYSVLTQLITSTKDILNKVNQYNQKITSYFKQPMV